ncbi:MAG TPA: hypothetical protein VKB80_25095 [Kofleriaceae bacterium]|nr:hypothetical protein [Kofleriaceae bacterium]
MTVGRAQRWAIVRVLAVPAWAPVLALALVGGAACTDFEDPTVVLDTRILGIRAEPPEVVVPYDPEDPTAVDPADLVPVEVCALVADPSDERPLDYSMALCRPTGDGICDVDPTIELGSGQVEDPETAEQPVQMCATIEPGADLLAVVADAIDDDDLGGFGGISVQVELRVSPATGEGEEVVGFKRVRYSPRLPAERVANTNPTASGITGLRRPGGQRGRDFEVPLGRCGDIEPFEVFAGERVQLLPGEPPGVREEYVVPTFDGGSRHFTENLTYQWQSTEGDWSPFTSGGTIDVAGNEPPLDSIWTAPDDADAIGEGLDVRMWFVQRDERGGQAWYESCARVLP